MRRVLTCLLLLFCGVTFYALQGERYANEGIAWYQRGDYDKAISQFLAADRSAGGKVPEYHYWLGRLYFAKADTVDARAWLDRYVASGDREYRDKVDAYYRIIRRQQSIFTDVSVRPMPSYVNSRSSDYGAVTDPEGKYLYFTSLRPDRLGKENIWRVELFRSGYGKPEVVKGLSSDKNESFGSFSSDGSTAWLAGNFEPGKLDGDLYSVMKSGGWSVPQNMSALNSPQVDLQPMVYRDSLLFFASSREGGLGGLDIYVSQKVNGVWTVPQNLGPTVNTAGNEQTPFLDADGNTLYFASNGHPGFGGYDIFKTYWIGNTWQNWSVPENLGLPLNSTRNDRYFFHIPATNEGYISSDRMVSGFEKIYQVNFQYSEQPSYIVLNEAGEMISQPIAVERPLAGQEAEEETLVAKTTEFPELGKPQAMEEEVQTIVPPEQPSEPVHQTVETDQPAAGKELPEDKPMIVADFRPLEKPAESGTTELYLQPPSQENLGQIEEPPAVAKLPVQQPPYQEQPAILPPEHPESNLELIPTEKPEGVPGIEPAVSSHKVRFRGTVTDLEGHPVLSNVEVTGVTEGVRNRNIVITSGLGEFDTELRWAPSWDVVVNEGGYLIYSETVDLEPETEAVNLNIFLKKLEKKKAIAFGSIFFADKSADLTPEEKKALDDVVLTLLNNPSIKVKVSGHAYDTGTPRMNLDLSDQRAKIVVDYLISKGIDKKRLRWEGFGNNQPIYGLTDESESGKNRRVEIEVIK